MSENIGKSIRVVTATVFTKFVQGFVLMHWMKCSSLSPTYLLHGWHFYQGKDKIEQTNHTEI